MAKSQEDQDQPRQNQTGPNKKSTHDSSVNSSPAAKKSSAAGEFFCANIPRGSIH
jgi:hypothetical protein